MEKELVTADNTAYGMKSDLELSDDVAYITTTNTVVTADNAAYDMNPDLELSDNVAYTTTTTNTVDKINETETYDYISTAEKNIISNEAYEMSIY